MITVPPFEVVLYIPEPIRDLYDGACYQTLFVDAELRKTRLSAFMDENGDIEPTFIIMAALSHGAIMFCDSILQEMLIKQLLGLPFCCRSVQSFESAKKRAI